MLGRTTTAVLDALPQPVLVLDAEGLLVYANPAARERFDATERQFCFAITRGASARCNPCPIAEVLRDGQPRPCLFERNGVRMAFRLSSLGDGLFLATLAEASPVGTLPGEARDLLQAILDASSDAIIACDRDHQVEFVNRSLVERTGVPAAALIGRDYRAIWPQVGKTSWTEMSERVLERGEVVRLNDYKYEGSVGGGTVWADFTFSPRRDADGAIVGSVTTAHYLTEERTLALRLAETEQRYQSLFEQAPVGIVLVGADRRFRLANPTARRLLGLDEADVGRGFDAVVTSPERARMLAAFQRVTETGRHLPEGSEYVVTDPGGERRHLHVRTGEVEYQGERCVHAVFIDVTEFKRLQAQLDRSEKLAGLGALAARVAHEFNNILAAIQGRAEIIHDAGQEGLPLLAECAAAIVRHCRRGAEIVEDIASVGAIRPLRPQPARWEDAVEEALASLGPRLEACHASIERDYRARQGIQADPGQVQQLVFNLLQNAREALLPQGGGTIRVATWDDEDGVTLEVADTGVGMDEPTRQRIFEPFASTKGDDSSSDSLGMGLGMVVVASIVRAHGGRIIIKSTPGQGTRLRVTFPASQERPSRRRSLTPLGVALAPDHPPRVVVVDDDEDVTEMIALALTTRGCDVHPINDPRQAIEVCVEVEAQVLVVDILMPLMNGVEMLREIRRRGVTTPAVVLSGRRGDPPDELLEELGVVQRLHKPVGLRELFGALDEAVGQEIHGVPATEASPARPVSDDVS